jgi:hypothetical protein
MMNKLNGANSERSVLLAAKGVPKYPAPVFKSKGTFHQRNPKFAVAIQKDSGATDKELLEHDKPFIYGDDHSEIRTMEDLKHHIKLDKEPCRKQE